MQFPRIERIHVPENNGIPNHPDFPALLYRGVLKEDDVCDFAGVFEERFRQNGWGNCWRWGVYSFHHFHSNAFEVLGVASGMAHLVIGGPAGQPVQVRAGDLLLLPPGTGHKNARASADFLVVGAYPRGQESYDLVRGGGLIDEAVRRDIVRTPVPGTDPFFGSERPPPFSPPGDRP